MEDNKSAKGFMLGMLAGGIAGGLVALLYAPKSGVELRGDIRKKSQELLTETGQYIGTARDRAGEMLNEGRKKQVNLLTMPRKKPEYFRKISVTYLHRAKKNLMKKVRK